MSRYTDWFEGKYEVPREPGLYQIQVPHVAGPAFSLWDGSRWYRHSTKPQVAAVATQESIYSDVPWRGLLKQQKSHKQPSLVTKERAKKPKPTLQVTPEEIRMLYR